MKIQLIRNATMKISYAGRTFLTDPMLSPKDEIRSFAGIARNPTIELPLPIEEIVKGIDGVIVSHDHPDHFDKAASLALTNVVPVFCQPGDEIRLREEGFQTVVPIEDIHVWEGITITRTDGKHGKGKIIERTGEVSGFVFQANSEPTVYWVGDSIFCEEVENTINRFSPAIIITHSGGATLPGYESIIMDGEQTLAVINASQEAVVVAIHMESLDHCTVTREALRLMAEKTGMPKSRLIIPKDGEIVTF